MSKKIVNLPAKHLNIKPLTREEMHNAAHERVALITKEFMDGFEFIRHYPKSVTFFGGARFTEDNPYYIKARSLSERIAKDLGYSVFTGGGPGIMEAANRGAFESGGQSLGLTIELPEEQATNPYLNRHLGFYYFFSRKVCMSFSAEAYIFLPGGFGTMDEFFEIITLIQTHKIERVPMILVGSDFWNKIDELFRAEFVSRKMVDADDLNLYTICDSEDEIIEIIKNSPVRNGLKFEGPIVKN
ncbi:MAG: TIGR00730 family Rossman fold protein [bacterium]